MKHFIIFLAFLDVVLCYGQGSVHTEQQVNSIPNKQYVSVNELYSDIVLPSYSSEEKVHAITTWITSNIDYAVDYEYSGSPLETIKGRKGVCQDYSELFKAFCDLASIECLVVVGNAKAYDSEIGIDIQSNHAWNVVKLNSQYKLYDLTWASGHVDGELYTRELNRDYLNAKPEYFVTNHFPDDPKWQLLDDPISKEEYIDSPFMDWDFLRLNIRNLSPSTGVIFSDTLQLKFESDVEIKSASLLKWRLNEYGSVYGIDLDIEKHENNYTIEYIEENSGAYRYTIYLNNDASVTYKLITKDFKPTKPSSWDSTAPYGQIEAYYYVFYSFDYDLFLELNPNSQITDLATVPNANNLRESMNGWYGDLSNTYIVGYDDTISYPINGFEIVLKKNSQGYSFERIIETVNKK